MTTPLRPTSMIEKDFADAEQMADAARDISRDDPFVALMLDGNDTDVARLRDELNAARCSDIEVSIEGRPVTEHRIAASFLARIVSDLQSAYRATARIVETATTPSESATALSIPATPPGSFRIMFRTAEEPLSLLERPLSERTLESLFGVIDEAGPSRQAWAASASENGVRSMIRLAATMASSQGTTQFRWTPPDGTDRVIGVSAAHARAIATELAGAVGREIITVRGHLGMAQDDPPRIRVTTETDEHVAEVRDDALLDTIRELIFENVEAAIVIDMSTSPTTGAPRQTAELLSLRAVSDEPRS